MAAAGVGSKIMTHLKGNWGKYALGTGALAAGAYFLGGSGGSAKPQNGPSTDTFTPSQTGH